MERKMAGSQKHVKEFIEINEAAYISLIERLTAIPAPSFHEEKRAEWIRNYLDQMGYAQAFIDDANNVICELGGASEAQELHLYTAHTDTVFPDMTPFEVQHRDGRMCAPGIGDDTANVCAVLMILQYIKENRITLPVPTVFALNSCEEGLGNLTGIKALMTRYGKCVVQMVSFDCGCDTIVSKAVGSKRYRIHVKTPGGHSYGSYGNPNAIAAAAEMIHVLYQTDAAVYPGKTTQNVGLISGGTSVNTIAQSAEFLYEYRSDCAEGMRAMEKQFKHVQQKFAGIRETEYTYTLIGDRPSMGKVPADRQQALAAEAERVIKACTGITPECCSGSTDCNIPLSMGIPAISFGVYLGAGAHTREEYICRDSLKTGLQAAMQFVLGEGTIA